MLSQASPTSCSINTSGNIVKRIANLPLKHKSTLQPSSTDTFSVLHTLVGVAIAEDLCCDAPSSTNVLVGRVNGCDFVDYQRSGDLNIGIS